MSEMNEFLTLDLPELRRRLEDHKATRPADHFGKEMQTWMTTKGRITFAIELKEAEERQQPFHITVPPQPIERPVQPLLRLRKAKPSTQAVPIPEAPMPKAAPTRGRHHDPHGRIQHLVGVLRAAAEKQEKCYWAQQEIREICAFYQLDVPPEAQKTRPVAQAAPAHPAEPAQAAPPQPPAVHPFEGYAWFREMDRRLLDNLSHFRNSERKPEEWRQIARDLAILETTAGAARQIAERHAEAS